MKRLLKTWIILLGACIGLGFVVGVVEKRRGMKGWVDGHKVHGVYERNVKRPLDFGLSLFAMLLFWPVMLVMGLLVYFKLGLPILFTQQRSGLGGKPFTIKKYRTMKDGEGSDEERMTGFGRKLRSFSLDELPQLLNIIRGDMSIIGPRPLFMEYLERYNDTQVHRHDVRPGLTGYAQVSGRNELSWDEKFADDVEYANHISFVFDLKILLKTVVVVLGKKGISSKTSETMEVFIGNKQ